MDILAWKRHDTFYFVDGNICLCALSSQSSSTTQAARADANTADTLRNPKPAGFIFRVHRTVLSLHSPVFKDMFNMPDLSASSEAYDGVALVRMPDTAEDLESLLSAFYFGYKLPYPRLDPRTPDGVRNILLMANKYQVDTIRQQIVERLESDWPQTLAGWERLEAEFAAQRQYLIRTNGWLSSNDAELDNTFPEPASAIRLARDCDVPNILPAAFYHLSRISIEDDWDALRSNPHAIIAGRTAKWLLLDADDLRQLMKGKKAISEGNEAWYIIGFCDKDEESEDLSDEDSMDEDGQEDCQLQADRAEVLWNIFSREMRSQDDILKCFANVQKEFASKQLCRRCRNHLKTRLDCEVVWQNIPKWFGLA